ncbi:MAG: hypothetical protein LBQ11_01110 [Candidatus Nomurabacteria bacterium]|jgi:hypothetical protein|nr:hypothetical protein [Candidatus Nomurabacteria bacterium]
MKKVKFKAKDGLEMLESEIESFILNTMTFEDKAEYEIAEVDGHTPEEVAPLFGGMYGINRYHIPNSYDAVLAGIYNLPFRGGGLSDDEIAKIPKKSVIYGDFWGRMGDENGIFAVVYTDGRVIELRETIDSDEKSYYALLEKFGYDKNKAEELDEDTFNRSYGGFGRVVMVNKSYDVEIDGGHLTLTLDDKKYMFQPWMQGTMITLIEEYKTNKISRRLRPLDPLMEDVRKLEKEHGKVSRPIIQRHMKFGFEISEQLYERYKQEEEV